LGGRTFILTTSHRSLVELAQLLEQPLREEGISLLVQGQAPPGQLLRRFASSGAHVLLGVDTFWEGVDIPGERLSCVVLTRLPFPVPTDPLFLARCRRIDHCGGSSFDELSLPLAALKLKQGFGRLLRSSSDRGIFLLLDPRIGRKAYGRTLARHLPGGHASLASPERLVQQALDWAEKNLCRNQGDIQGFPFT
jgi:ATP-dependent DNA helicase DinG